MCKILWLVIISGDFCTEAVKSTGWRFIDGSSCGNRETGTCVLGWAVTCSFSVTASCWDFLVYLHFKMFITICTKLLIKPEGKKKNIYIYIHTHTHILQFKISGLHGDSMLHRWDYKFCLHCNIFIYLH